MLAKVLVVPAIAILLTCDLAEARKGGFVSALIRGGAHAAGSSPKDAPGSSAGTSTSVSAAKTYGPDTLTLTQLERCVGVAVELDHSSDTVDARAGAMNRKSPQSRQRSRTCPPRKHASTGGQRRVSMRSIASSTP